MKKSRFTPEQFAFGLRQAAEEGTPVPRGNQQVDALLSTSAGDRERWYRHTRRPLECPVDRSSVLVWATGAGATPLIVRNCFSGGGEVWPPAWLDPHLKSLLFDAKAHETYRHRRPQ